MTEIIDNPLYAIEKIIVVRQHNCIFCLEECGFTQHKNSWCECQISYHKRCFDLWNNQYKNECPICRKKPETVIMQETQISTRAVLAKLAVFVLLFLIIIALLGICIKIIVDSYKK